LSTTRDFMEACMRIINHCFFLLAVLALTVVPAVADEMISAKVGYQVLSPDGTFAVSGGGLAGSPIDLENDLGYDDSQNLTAEVALQLGDLRLAAGYLPINFSGEGTLNRTVIFNGRTYSATARAASDVDINLYDVGLSYYILNFDDLPVRFQLAPELSVKIFDASLSLDGQENLTGTSLHEEESGIAGIPTIGARARVGFSDFFAVLGRVGYLEFNDNSFLDVDGQIEFSPIPLAGVYGGYRYFDVTVDEDNVYIDTQFSGPYVGAFVRF
jgi:outer membrane protein